MLIDLHDLIFKEFNTFTTNNLYIKKNLLQLIIVMRHNNKLISTFVIKLD